MTCNDCQNAVKESQDQKVNRWIQARGLGFCRAYSKRLSRKFLIPLFNAAGPVCGGRDYQAIGGQATLL